MEPTASLDLLDLSQSDVTSLSAVAVAAVVTVLQLQATLPEAWNLPASSPLTEWLGLLAN